MSVAIRRNIEISIDVSGDKVIIVCRRPTPQEQSAFLNARFEAKGRKVRSHLYEAREALIDKIMVDVRNATYETAAGELKPLNSQTVLAQQDQDHWSSILGVQVQNWKDLIPVSWKSSAAMHFEDPHPEDDEEAQGAPKN